MLHPSSLIYSASLYGSLAMAAGETELLVLAERGEYLPIEECGAC